MIEFLGGPLDGFISEDRTELVPTLVVRLNRESIIYERVDAAKAVCASGTNAASYRFVGYTQEAVAPHK